MARKARFTAALPVYVEQQTRDRINRIAEQFDLSQAEVVRMVVNEGLPAVELRYWGA